MLDTASQDTLRAPWRRLEVSRGELRVFRAHKGLGFRVRVEGKELSTGFKGAQKRAQGFGGGEGFYLDLVARKPEP